MGRGKYKNKPTGQYQFSSREDLLAGTSTRPRSFSKVTLCHTVFVVTVMQISIFRFK
ncbi:hypothetical protein RchiOBHm_Chr3g0496141 [Rosa chinensis]|uniref:Uncharacterized protein n=1 Tax=Rosa chinensis TaxID=74649 RepID=A0A2P6RHD9_ROSCH|nr:hypothetical protein RchiOBHm_Chr3g0496141 [Rosa chinensis]